MLVSMKYLIALLLAFFTLHGFTFTNDKPMALVVHNAILAKVNGKAISVLDVKKKMDFLFYRFYPDLADSEQARYQFYQATWQRTLDDLINTQLMIADAEAKELKLADGEIREEMELRFGPNIMLSLAKASLSYEEAFEMVKNEMIVQRMTWFYIHSKALQSVTPQKVRKAYQAYCLENPEQEQWTYQIVTIKKELSSADSPNDLEEDFYQLCSNLQGFSPADLTQENAFSSDYEIISSNVYEVNPKDLSKNYFQTLQDLQEGEFSKPIFSSAKKTDNSKAVKLLYLISKSKSEIPPFENLYSKLNESLLEQESMTFSEEYIQKLRQYYNFSEEEIPQNFQAFTLQH